MVKLTDEQRTEFLRVRGLEKVSEQAQAIDAILQWHFELMECFNDADGKLADFHSSIVDHLEAARQLLDQLIVDYPEDYS